MPELKGWLGPEGQVFPSSEHLWQALKAKNLRTFLRFTVGGDFGSWAPDVFVRTTLRNKVKNLSARKALLLGQSKVVHWAKKQNIGILAKIAANSEYAADLQLDEIGDMNYAREHLPDDVERAVWLAILKQKYSQDPLLQLLLTNTGDEMLVEFEKAAARTPSKVKWGGCISPSGVLLGRNVMGTYLMATRAALV